MNLFTPNERKAIYSLLILLAIGLTVGEIRDRRAAQWGGADVSFNLEFQEGVEAYRATSIDEPIAPIRINFASAIELQQLPGVGPVMAKKIIDYRRKNGYFQTVEELINIDGVGPKSVARWQDLIITIAEAVTIDSTIID